jgi:hypothetical protein
MTAGGAGADVWPGLGRSDTDIAEGGVDVGVAELGERFAGGSAGCDGGQALVGAAAVLPDVQIRAATTPRCASSRSPRATCLL